MVTPRQSAGQNSRAAAGPAWPPTPGVLAQVMSAHTRWVSVLADAEPGSPAHGAALVSALVMQASTATYYGGALASDHAGGVGNLNHCCGWHRSGQTRAEQLPCGQGAATGTRKRDSLTLQNGQDW